MNVSRTKNFIASWGPIPDRTGARWFVWSFVLSLLTLLLFPCMCGCFGTDALPTSSFGVVLAWYPFIRYERARILDCCLAVFFVLFASLIFLKNVPMFFGLGINRYSNGHGNAQPCTATPIL